MHGLQILSKKVKMILLQSHCFVLLYVIYIFHLLIFNPVNSAPAPYIYTRYNSLKLNITFLNDISSFQGDHLYKTMLSGIRMMTSYSSRKASPKFGTYMPRRKARNECSNGLKAVHDNFSSRNFDSVIHK